MFESAILFWCDANLKKFQKKLLRIEAILFYGLLFFDIGGILELGSLTSLCKKNVLCNYNHNMLVPRILHSTVIVKAKEWSYC